MKGREESLARTKIKLEKALEKEKDAEPLKERIKVLEEKIADIDKLKVEGDSLMELQRKYQEHKRELDRLDKDKKSLQKDKDTRTSRLENRIKVNEDRVAKLTTDIGRDEAFDMLRREGTLQERTDRIAKELEWLSQNEALVKDLTKERNEAQAELDFLKERTSSINADSFILSEITSNIEGLKKDLEALAYDHDQKLKELDTKVADVKAQIKDIGFGGGQKKRLSEIRNKVSKMRDIRLELDEKRNAYTEIGDMSNLIKDLESQVATSTQELKGMREQFETMKDVEKEYQKVQEESERVQRERESYQREIYGAEGEIKGLKARIEELKETKAKMDQRVKELADVQQKGEVLSILKDKVFHKRGIVMYAIDQLLPQLSLETSQNLDDMTDGRFSRVRLTSYEKNNQYGIRIETIGPDGQWHDVMEFSGGEKTQINAALRFALAKELASMPQVGRTYGRMKTLFIDEGDLGSLDTETSRELFVKKLFDMGEFFERIILITHLSEVAERFPGRIIVYMTPEEESRIKVMS